jgi:hypothetical protein
VARADGIHTEIAEERRAGGGFVRPGNYAEVYPFGAWVTAGGFRAGAVVSVRATLSTSSGAAAAMRGVARSLASATAEADLAIARQSTAAVAQARCSLATPCASDDQVAQQVPDRPRISPKILALALALAET